ncbi:MAG: hypothetical protein US42_C0001G0016 [Candidatus Magasanikbacteria bacterium GW2011_GWC2_37_14]|uniref:Uncharacterized protein n=1 Tax=Candidatus Magasanikbacteria bacterium GW2011_GWC2_37_14 TaxID=1619046 RepID=A0A0G0GPT3_9BACT|nr:MAG: hypothetical protein US42_C0001G0016 [Candidatus Magasanikbacteria bacterium GW2011_GWC2_37_14]
MAIKNPRFIRLAYVALALLAAILFEQLVVQSESWGMGVFLMIVFLGLGFASLTKYTNHLNNRWALWLLVPIYILAFDLMLYNNALVVYFLPLVIFVLVIFFAIVLTVRNESKFVFYFKNIPVVKNVFVGIKNLGLVFGDLFSWKKEDKHSEIYKQVAVGLIVAAPVLLLFTLLFAGADKVFSSGLERIFRINIDLDFHLVAQIIRTIILTFLASAFFYTLISHENALKDGIKIRQKISFTIASVVLLSVNILFAIFVFIQIKYLFGAHDFVISNGLTFAEYARSGFFQLVWVMIFSAILLLVFYHSSAHHGKNNFVSALKLLLILQIFVIALSALKRMNLYQAEYGYTTLRLYVEWFIYFAGVVYFTLGLAIITNYSFRKFFYGGLILSLVVFTLVASLNVDAIIAKKNIDRFLTENKKMDLRYLMFSLSADSIPEIVRLNQYIGLKKVEPLEVNRKEVVDPGIIDKSNIHTLAPWYSAELNHKRNRLYSQMISLSHFNLGAQRALNSINSIGL